MERLTLPVLISEAGFWHKKRVLITGHTGFKGSWLSLWLSALGAEVYGYALPAPTTPSLYAQADIGSIVQSVTGDICDFARLIDVIRTVQPEIVFHLAAQALVRESYQSPASTYAINVQGTVNVLEALRQIPCARVVQVITSDKCYDNPETGVALTEQHPLGGKDPYSSSKACAELVASAFRHSFFSNTDTSLATVRAGNVIGGGDWAIDRIIPDAVRAANTNTALILRNPNAVRPWQFVLEPLSGYLWLAEQQWHASKQFDCGWNFGPSCTQPVTVETLAAQFYAEYGSGTVTAESDAHSWPEAHLLQLSIEQAITRLKWSPVYTIDQCITQTAQWYKYCRVPRAPHDVRQYCLSQIDDYTHQARQQGILWALR